MKKILFILNLLALASAGLNADALEIRRFGLFIGANDGGRERQTLRYADDDASAIAETMKDIGGIAPEDSRLLLNPTSVEIRRELQSLSREISRADSLVRRTEVMFYYSGHSDNKGLLLADQQIPYKEIRDELDSSGADVVIAVLDSCSSGAFTRSKGGERRSPFLIDDSSAMEGHAFLTSSSETEISQESDSLRGSFFTHSLISGLRGAADNTRDGRVTLNEVYQHTYAETLSRTESTLGGPQHPAYEIQLTGTGDLVLTDLTIPTSALQLSGELEGRFSIRDTWERLIAEFSKPEGDTLKLALPSGSYTIRLEGMGNIWNSEVNLSRNAQLYLRKQDFQAARDFEFTRFRGSTDRQNRPLKNVFSIIPGLDYPEIEENDLVQLQFGLIGAHAPQLSGVQFSGIWNYSENPSEGAQISYVCSLADQDFRGIQVSNIFNYTGGLMEGIQSGGIFNYVGQDMKGIQTAGIFNITEKTVQGIQAGGIFNITEGSFRGIQAAGIFNIMGRPSSGIQAGGIFNIAGELKGIQTAGIFNTSSYLEGVQISLVNLCGTMRGLQLGLVNISREVHGLPVGLINLSRNGIVDVGFWFEYQEDYRLYSSFQSGTNYFYTLYYFGNSTKDYFQDPENMVWGFHIGSRLELGPLAVDLDAGAKQSYRDIKDSGGFQTIPSARALIALKGIGIFWGITMNLAYPEAPDSSLYEGQSFLLFGRDDYRAYYNYILGIRF